MPCSKPFAPMPLPVSRLVARRPDRDYPDGAAAARHLHSAGHQAAYRREHAASDLATPWIDQFNTASADATTLLNTFYDAPYIGLQQPIANKSGFLQDFFDKPDEQHGHRRDGADAGQPGRGVDRLRAAERDHRHRHRHTTDTVLTHTVDALSFSHVRRDSRLLAGGDAAEITPIINFLASPASGIIMGDVGPFISPFVALINSIGAGDDLNTTLADMYGAFFNGATLGLNSLLPTINGLDLFPPGMEMGNLDIAFGGLLSPGYVGCIGPPASTSPLGRRIDL